MTPERWRRIDALFHAAAALPPEERARLLDAECAADDALRNEVENLLQDDRDGDTVEGVISGTAAEAVRSRESWQGQRLGPWRVLHRIGEGGMGAVFLAVRDDEQFRKQAAIKVLRFEFYSESMLSRFRRERQVLADLEHPHIARLLDGGASEQGIPWIAMEYVAGVPITDYCAGKNLNVEARLRLFQQVCDAVQYAHSRLVIHRDIKPANILVSPEGVPKLLDFGIAKLIDAEEPAAAGEATVTNAVLLTPRYASPEQVRGEVVSTATDVYSLGAVLYELLTGVPAHVFSTSDFAEVARVITEQNLVPPSVPGGRRLRGDLDNIVLKAMQKEPSRRYGTVKGLSEDIDRYLDGLPVTARPDSLSYRTGRYVRRHWFAVASLAVVMLALGIGLGIALQQARLAREQFGNVRMLANHFLFDFYDSISLVPGTTKAKELIASTALEYLGKLEQSAGSDRTLQREIASAWVKVARVQGFPGEPNLGRTADAYKSLEKSAALHSHLNPNTPEEITEAIEPLARLAFLEIDQGHYAQSVAFSKRAIALAERVPADKVTAELATAHGLTWARMVAALEELGDSEAGYQAARKGMVILSAYAARDGSQNFDPRPRPLIAQLEVGARQTGRLDEAVALLEEGLSRWGSGPVMRPYYISRLGETYASVDGPSWDNATKAIELTLEAIEQIERNLRIDPADVNTKYSLAVEKSRIGYFLRQSDPERAVQALEFTIRCFEEMAHADPDNTEYPLRLARYRARMALARSFLHQQRQVEDLTTTVLAVKEAQGQNRLHLLNLCAEALANVGSPKRAAALFEDAIVMAEDLLAREGGRMATQIEATRSIEQYADFVRKTGDLARADRLLRRTAAVWGAREPVTTYVKLRRERSERLLLALRNGR